MVRTAKRAAALPPAERRAAIVEATEPLLLEYGESVTTRQIAEAAGIAEGTIFRVFADKHELLSATLDAALDVAPFEKAVWDIDPSLPFETRLVEATRLIQQRFESVWRLVSNLGPELQRHAARARRDSSALTDLFRCGSDQIQIEPADAARMLRALTMSFTHPLLAGPPKDAEEIVSLLLHGVSSRPE